METREIISCVIILCFTILMFAASIIEYHANDKTEIIEFPKKHIQLLF